VLAGRWYEQAGTPTLTVDPSYDEAKQTFTLDVKQALPPTPGQSSKQPVLIPLAVALLGPDGKELQLRLQVGTGAASAVGSRPQYSLCCGKVPT
jgi:aminopeptidase N